MKHLSEIEKFVIALSGVKIHYIEKLNTEHIKYFGIGCTILFTALFAIISSSYALYRVFLIDSTGAPNENASIIAISFGILWGLMILNLDRYIVSSMQKENNFFIEIFLALPRIIVAGLISVVVAVPLEIKLFENRILEEISIMSSQSLKNQTATEAANLSAAEGNLSNTGQKLADINTRRSNYPPQIKSLEMQALASNKDYENTLTHNNAIISGLSSQIVSYEQKITQEDRKSIPDQQLIGEYRSRIYSLRSKISEARIEISNKKIVRDNLQYDLESNINKHNASLDKEYDDIIIERNRNTAVLDSANAEYKDKRNNVNKINQISFSPTLVTQIEAFGSLLEKDKFLEKCSLLITLLFFFIEIAPILVKLISRPGTYDNFLKIKQHEETHRANLESEVVKKEHEQYFKAKEHTKENIYNNQKTVEEDFYNRTRDANLEMNAHFFTKIINARKGRADFVIQEFLDGKVPYSKAILRFLSSVGDNITSDEHLRSRLYEEYTDNRKDDLTNKEDMKKNEKTLFERVLSSKLIIVMFTLLSILLTLKFVEKYYPHDSMAMLAVLVPAVTGIGTLLLNSKNAKSDGE